MILSLVERTLPAMRRGILTAPQSAGVVEVRLDCLPRGGRGRLAWLFDGSPRPILATCRPRSQAGLYAGSESARTDLLMEAVRAGASWLDIEMGSKAQTLADALADTSGVRIILSHHDAKGWPRGARALRRRMRRVRGVAAHKIIGTARRPADLLRVHRFLQGQAGRAQELTAFCMGGAGTMSRVAATHWGSWASYACAQRGQEAAPGQISLEEMERVYRPDEIDDETRWAALIGSPITHSVSPAMHNAAYAAQGINFRYVPMEITTASGLADLRPLCRALRLRGFSVTAPWKVSMARRVDRLEPAARQIGAVNTVVWDGRRMLGFNTDVTGATSALEEVLGSAGRRLEGLRVAIVGAGGSARAVAHGASQGGAQVLVAARRPAEAARLARAVGGTSCRIADLVRRDYDVLVNATPVGTSGGRTALPVPARAVRGLLVFDLVYNPPETALLRLARKRRILTLNGLEMVVRQAAEQHTLFTGHEPPLDVMREAARAALK